MNVAVRPLSLERPCRRGRRRGARVAAVVLGAALVFTRPVSAQVPTGPQMPTGADSLWRALGSDEVPAAPADSVAVRESVAAPADTLAPADAVVPTSVHGGGDTRLVRGWGTAEAVAALPGVRVSGIGWPCHRASVANGALPAAFTGLSVTGADGDDWVTGGIDLLSSWAAGPNAILVFDGPDLSLWPATSSALLTAGAGPSAAPASGALFAVRVSPGRPVGSRPYARATMVAGGRGFGASAVEFGRTFFSGDVGVQGFLDEREGRAAVAGGLSQLRSFGGSVAATYPGSLSVRFDGVRTDVERGIPLLGLVPSPLLENLVRSDATLSVVGARDVLRLSRTTTWLRPERAGDARFVESTVNGAGADLFIGWGRVDSLALEIEEREADGSLLAESRRAFGWRALATKALPFTSGSVLSIAVGAESLDDDAYPLGRLSFSSMGARPAGENALLWRAALRIGGRHPGVLERFLLPTTVPAPEDGPVSVGGTASLSAERAAVASVSCETTPAALSVGALAEVARLFSPVALGRPEGGLRALENADDETAARLSAWARSDAPGPFGWRARVDARFLEESGALLARSPSPLVALEGALWMSHYLFARDFVDARLEVSVSHQAGLASGPWQGALDDQSTAVGIAATGEAGPVRFFVAVDDLLDAASSLLPGIAPFGRRMTAGFSWGFWD